MPDSINPKFTPPRFIRDYDGFIREWNEYGILPPDVEQFLGFVRANTKKSDRLVEIGSGNGLVSAALSADYTVTAVDLIPPPAQGAQRHLRVSPGSTEFFDFIDANCDVLIARRSQVHFYSPIWMKELLNTNVKKMLVESLRNEKHPIRNQDIEVRYLTKNGWTASPFGDRFVIAKR